MKKVILAVIALMGLSAAGFAQTNAPAKKAQPAKMQVTTKATSTRAPQAKTPVVNKTVTASTSAPAMQAASKAIVKNTAKPLKKDGTPDRRYKANKRMAKVHHMKKNGSPDKRFKENKQPS